MKKIAFLLTLVVLVCGCNPPGQEPEGVATTPNQTPAVLSSEAADAARKAYAGNHGEVELALIALQTTKNPEVKELATMIQDDHQKAEQRLAAMAGELGLTFEEDATPEQERLKKEISEMEGAAFDRYYVDSQVEMHQKDLEFYRNQAQSTNNAQLKSYYSETVPVLEKHLKKAKEVQSALVQAP